MKLSDWCGRRARASLRDLIERYVADGRHSMSMWQELVEKRGFTARYAAVQRFVRGLRETQPPEARVVIATTPGEEAQVDYGDGLACPSNGYE